MASSSRFFGQRKAQVAVELFLGMTLFLLVLYWMNYFAASVRDSSTALLDEERFAVASLVQAANSVCAANTSITLSLPCLSVEGKNVNYSLNANGSDNVLRLIPEESRAPWVSKQALCNFSGASVKARCSASSAGSAGGAESVGSAGGGAAAGAAVGAAERSAGSVCLNLSGNAVGIWRGTC